MNQFRPEEHQEHKTPYKKIQVGTETDLKTTLIQFIYLTELLLTVQVL